MRIQRSLVGRFVQVKWLDPRTGRFEGTDLNDMPKARKALAIYHDRGVLGDLTEGVLRIEHSHGITFDITGEPSHTVWFSVIPEELVIELTEFMPVEPRVEPVPSVP